MSIKLPVERAMDALNSIRDMRVRFRNGEDISEEAISELRMNVVEKADPFAANIELAQVLESLINELEEFEIEVFNSKSEAKEIVIAGSDEAKARAKDRISDEEVNF